MKARNKASYKIELPDTLSPPDVLPTMLSLSTRLSMMRATALFFISYIAIASAAPGSTSQGASGCDFGDVVTAGDGDFAWDDIQYMYAFGDSYTFVQGSLGLANFSFIGDFLNLSFTPSELLADEILSKNTSSDGANWIEFLTGCFSGRPSACSPVQLWNFAFAGADIDGNLLPLHHPFTVPLVDQVKQWAQYAADVIPHPKNSSLTAWWIGINDTGDSTGNETITDIHVFYEAEMDSLFAAVELAYSAGLKGAHLFINVPPEERSPSGLNSTRHDAQKSNIEDYNAQLSARVSQFAANHTEDKVTVLTFDAHGWFNFALDNADDLGFTNTTGFCTCTDPGFFWYDTGHPTEHTHRLLAQAIEDFLRSV